MYILYFIPIFIQFIYVYIFVFNESTNFTLRVALMLQGTSVLLCVLRLITLDLNLCSRTDVYILSLSTSRLNSLTPGSWGIALINLFV